MKYTLDDLIDFIDKEVKYNNSLAYHNTADKFKAVLEELYRLKDLEK